MSSWINAAVDELEGHVILQQHCVFVQVDSQDAVTVSNVVVGRCTRLEDEVLAVQGTLLANKRRLCL